MTPKQYHSTVGNATTRLLCGEAASTNVFLCPILCPFSATLLNRVLLYAGTHSVPMTERSTDKHLESSIAEALELLLDGYSPASIIKQMSRSKKVSIRQARRYVAAAKLDYFDAPMTRNELEFGIQLHIERLDRIADSAHQAGETKQEISAAKASAQLSEQRLKSLQREQEHTTKSDSKSICF